MGWVLRRVAAAFLLVGFTSCSEFAPNSWQSSTQQAVGARLNALNPARAPFEPILDAGIGFVEAVFAVDALVYPDLDIPSARHAFHSVRQRFEERIQERRGSSPSPVAPSRLARWALATLEEAGYRFDPAAKSAPWAPDGKVFSYTLLRQTGTCGTLTLLGLALLDSVGIQAAGVCIPGHCFIRVMDGPRAVDVESTTFGRRSEEALYSPDLPEKSGRFGYHYGASLEQRRFLWHYYVDRLWAWIEWRETDQFALAALKAAGACLDSTCESMLLQEARRHFLVACDPDLPQGQQAEAWDAAERKLARLLSWSPTDEEYAKALQNLHDLRKRGRRS